MSAHRGGLFIGLVKTFVCGLLFVVMLTGGCASYGRRLELSTVRKIQPQQTTRAEVEKLLGRPKETVVGAKGSTVARYFFHEFRRSTDASWYVQREHPGDILFRTLTLAYDSENRVQRKLHDESVTPIYRTNAWYFAGPALTPDVVSSIQSGSTPARDVVARLGEPSSRTFDNDGRAILLWFSLKTQQTTWSNPDVQRLMVSTDEKEIVRDFVLVEHALSEFEPLTLH